MTTIEPRDREAVEDRSPSTFRVISSALLTGWAAKVISMVVGFVTLPVIIVNLGKEQYGIWVLVGQIAGFLAFTDLGVTNAAGRFVARSRATSTPPLSELLSTITALMLAAGLLVGVLTLIISPWIANWLNVEPAFAQVTQLVFIISGLSLALMFPLRIGAGILTGCQRYEPGNIANIVGTIVKLSSILVLAGSGALDLIGIALITAVISFGVDTTLLILAWRAVRPLSIRLDQVSFSTMRAVLSLGSSNLLVTLGALLYRQGMTIAVGLLLGVAEAAVYGVALTIMTYLSSFLTQIPHPMMTLASEWQARNELERLRRTGNVLMRLSVALGMSTAAGLFFYSEPIIRLLLSNSDWTPSNFEQVRSALSIMGLGLAIGLPQLTARSILRGVGQHWGVSFRFVAACLTSLLLGCLGMYHGWGIASAALGWSLVWVSQGILLYPPMICQYLQQSAWHMIVRAYLPGGLAGGMVWLFAWAISTWLPPMDVLSLAVNVACCCVVGLIGTAIASGRVRALKAQLRRHRRTPEIGGK